MIPAEPRWVYRLYLPTTNCSSFNQLANYCLILIYLLKYLFSHIYIVFFLLLFFFFFFSFFFFFFFFFFSQTLLLTRLPLTPCVRGRARAHTPDPDPTSFSLTHTHTYVYVYALASTRVFATSWKGAIRGFSPR